MNNKKPSIKKFREVAEACGGNQSRIAKSFQVLRKTVRAWCAIDPEFQDTIDEYKGRLLDECMKSARIVALGIAKTERDPKTGLEKIVGWKEKPDSLMLRYLIGALGRKEGYGDSVDITSNGETIKADTVVIEVIDRRDKVRKENDSKGE